MEGRRQKLTKKCMSNVMNNNRPEIIGSFFEKCKSNDNFLKLSKPNTNSMKRRFSYMVTKT